MLDARNRRRSPAAPALRLTAVLRVRVRDVLILARDCWRRWVRRRPVGLHQLDVAEPAADLFVPRDLHDRTYGALPSPPGSATAAAGFRPGLLGQAPTGCCQAGPSSPDVDGNAARAPPPPSESVIDSAPRA